MMKNEYDSPNDDDYDDEEPPMLLTSMYLTRDEPTNYVKDTKINFPLLHSLSKVYVEDNVNVRDIALFRYNDYLFRFIQDMIPGTCVIVNPVEIGVDTKTNKISYEVTYDDFRQDYIKVQNADCVDVDKHDVIVIPTSFFETKDGKREPKSHQTVLIYFTKQNILEHFDPSPVRMYTENSKEIIQNIVIKHIFRRYFPKSDDVDFISSIDNLECPTIPWINISYTDEVKRMSPGGFCVAWSLYYLLVRIDNPLHNVYDVRREISKTLSDEKDILRFIRTFTNYILIRSKLEKEKPNLTLY